MTTAGRDSTYTGTSHGSAEPERTDVLDRERRLRLLLDNTPHFLGLLQSDGTILEANSAVIGVLGIPRGDAIVKPVWSAARESDEDAGLEDLLRSTLREAASGTLTRCEVPYRGADGLRHGIELSFRPVNGDGGHATLILAEGRDVTEQEARKAALQQDHDDLLASLQERTAKLTEANRLLKQEIGLRRRAEEASAKFAAIVEHSNDAIIGQLLDGTIVTWNKGAEHLFGYPEEEARGRSISMLVPPDRADEMTRIIQSIRRGKLVPPFETERLRKDGTLIHVSLTVSPIKDAAGRIVGASRIARDITQRKRIEQALRDSEARSRAILETAVDGIITIDERGVIESCNPAAERLFGYAAPEIIGHNVIALMPEPYRSEHDTYLANYLRAGKATIIGIGREVVGRRKDGTVIPVDLAVSELGVGGRRLFTGRVRDLSERKRLEQEILDISEREKRRIGQDLHDSLGQMLAGIGFKSKSLENKLASKALPEAAAAQQIAELVTQAVSQARALARGLQPVELKPTGLMTALQELTASLEPLFQVSGVFDCPQPVLLDDPAAANHLYRIAQEATNNAIKHGHASRIEISLLRDRDNLVLAIQDNGSGLPANGLNGTGMGLHIMHYRAAIVRGALAIHPAPSGGIVVTCSVSNSVLHTEETDDANHTVKSEGRGQAEGPDRR